MNNKPNLNKIIADNLDKAKFQSKSNPRLPKNGWLDDYAYGGYISDRAKATQFGQYKKGGQGCPEGYINIDGECIEKDSYEYKQMLSKGLIGTMEGDRFWGNKATLQPVTVVSSRDKDTQAFYDKLRKGNLDKYNALVNLGLMYGSPHVSLKEKAGTFDFLDPNAFNTQEENKKGYYRAHYNPNEQRMYLSANEDREDLRDRYISELAHQKQVMDKGALDFNLRVLSGLGRSGANIVKNLESPVDAYTREYYTPGSLEYEAHEKIEPKLRDKYKDLLDKQLGESLYYESPGFFQAYKPKQTYKRGGGYFPEYKSFAPPRMNEGTTVCYDDKGNVIPCEQKRLQELGSDAYTAMQPFYETLYGAANKYADKKTGEVSPFNSTRATLKALVKHPGVMFMKRHRIPSELMSMDADINPYHVQGYRTSLPLGEYKDWYPTDWAEPRKQRPGLGDWFNNMRSRQEDNRMRRKAKRDAGKTGCWGANCYEEENLDQAEYGGLAKYQVKGQVSQADSVRHLAGQTMDYEARKGSPAGTGLSDWGYHSSQLPYNKVSSNWHAPQTRDEAVDLYMQEIGTNPILGYFNTAMEKGEAGDFLYNTGRDPRVYMLDQYLRSKGQSGLPNRGSYNVDTKTPKWTPELQGSLDEVWNQYAPEINKLSENQRRILLNKGRDFYYQNINQVNGKPNPAYEATWKPRIWESVNTYKQQGGDISIPDLNADGWLTKYQTKGQVSFSLPDPRNLQREMVNRVDVPTTIQEKQRKEAEAEEFNRRNRVTAKRQFVGPARAQTIDEQRINEQKKRQYASQNPNAVYNEETGSLETKNPDRDLKGRALPNTRAARTDKGMSHIMNALEATAALTGAGQIGSNLLRLGASGLEKAIGRNLLSRNLKNFTSKINPTLNAIDEAGAYVQMDPVGIMGNRLNINYYNPTTALNTANNTITGVDKNLKNSAVEAADIFLGDNNLRNVASSSSEDLVDLYRVQDKGFDINSNTVAQMEKAAAEGRLSPVQKMMLNNEYDRKRLMARDKFWGQWFEKDPKRLEYYVKDKGPDSEILHIRVPRSEAPNYSIKNFESQEPIKGAPLEYHQRMSLSPETEFILPKDIIQGAKKYPLSEWERLIKEHKPWMGVLPLAGAAALEQKKKGGMITDSRGQWAHPGQNTRIPGSNITMQGVPYPVLAKASNGMTTMMYPNREYSFPGASHVDEYPLFKAQNGKQTGNPVSDWWYNLNDVQGTYKMYNDLDPFLKNWYQNPETQRRLKQNLQDSLLHRNTNPSQLTTQAINTLQKTPAFSRELVKKADVSASDLEYNNELQGWKSPSTFGGNPYFDSHNYMTGMSELGSYDPDTKQIILNSFDLPGTIAHEGVHAAEPLQKAMEDVIDWKYILKKDPKTRFSEQFGTLNWDANGKRVYEPFEKVKSRLSSIYSDWEKTQKYLDKDGMYPRIMDIRRTLNLKPGEKVDKSILENKSISHPLYDLKHYYDDDTIIEMLNTLAKNDTNKTITTAKNGGWLNKYQEGGTQYTVKPGDTLSSIAQKNKTTLRRLIDANNIDNPNLIRANQNLVIPSLSSNDQYKNIYQDWNTIRDKQQAINASKGTDEYSPDEQIITSYYNEHPNDSYVVVDKKRARMNVYKGNKLQKSYEVGTGANPGDAQTVTRVVNGKTDWDSGNRSTGAGVYTISNIDPESHEYFGLPAFNLKNDRGMEVATTIHGTPMARRAKFDNNNIADNRMSYGCINGKCYDLKDLYGRVDVGSNVYILPEDAGNQFQIVDGKPVLRVDAKNRAKYNTYTDKTGNVQKGQGVNQSINTLQYKPIRGILDKKQFQESVYQGNDFNDEEEYKSTTKPFFNALVNNKQKIMKSAKIPSDVYNELAKMAFGIYGTESNFGDTHSTLGNFGRAVSKVLNPSGSSSPDYKSKATTYGADEDNRSVGLTQLRWNYLNEDEKKALKELGITSNKDFLDPTKAAMGTVAVLGIRYNQQLTSDEKKDIWKNLPTRWNKRSNYADRVKSNSRYIRFEQLEPTLKQKPVSKVKVPYAAPQPTLNDYFSYNTLNKYGGQTNNWLSKYK